MGKDKGSRRPFIATGSLMLLNLRWVTEIYVNSLTQLLKATPGDENFKGQFDRTFASYNQIVEELDVRKIIVRNNPLETLRRAQAYDKRHWGSYDDFGDLPVITVEPIPEDGTDKQS